ncbi:hypothetical protein AWR27_14305 [Spirosoma montaniterrae]|uniref:Uncharacterized protein n=2 Tax=Spirosoma montaniterrae TaxID=1178516 RepID=A0A1P9WYD4_9BACT|nr:hypothetical protein AWR27_14305 [Spirosoma montaniterrae]
MQFVDNYDPQNAEIGSTVAYKNALGINPDAYNTYLNSVVNSNRGTLIITPTTLRTRISLNPGDRLIIRAEGSIKLGAFAGYGGPDGIDGFAAYSLASNIRHGSLIYVIGNADWQFAGSSKTITASKSGSLLMTVNDKQVDDDEGQFIVNYEIIRSTDGATTSPTPAPSVAASPVRATPVIEQNTNQPYNAPPSRPANSARNVDRSQLLYSGAANRFVNERAIGGKLYLYPDRLEFRSYLFKTLIDEQTILLDQIEQVEFYNPMDIFQNGLIVKTTDGKRQKFVVYGRDRWREEIYKLK